MRETRCAGPRTLRLAFGDPYLDAHGPCGAKHHREEVDGDDDDPASGTGVFVHGVGGVQDSHEEHDHAEGDAAVDGALTTAPFVGPDESGDGDGKNNDGGDTGSKERCACGFQASSFEEQWSVLQLSIHVS